MNDSFENLKAINLNSWRKASKSRENKLNDKYSPKINDAASYSSLERVDTQNFKEASLNRGEVIGDHRSTSDNYRNGAEHGLNHNPSIDSLNNKIEN